MGTEGLPVADRIWREKPSPQNLRNIFLLDRLYTLFLLAAENGIKLVRKFFAEGIALGWIGREQRRNDGAAVNFGSCLGEVLEEVHQLPTPRRIDTNLAARKHQDFVDEQECGEVLQIGRASCRERG